MWYPKEYKRLIGLFAILVGLIALVTPFTPGASWLIAIGLNLLGVHFIFLHHLGDILQKFPWLNILKRG